MIKSLAYVGVNSPRAEDWRRFGTGFLGAELAPDGPDGAVRLRVDDAAWRLEIHPAEEDSVAFFGWAVDHEEDLDTVVEKLAATGIIAERGSRELADARNVDRLITFTDPWGFPHEVIWVSSSTRRHSVPVALAPASSPAPRAWVTCCS